MEKKNLKKWVIEKETISNLFKDAQGMIIGGYGTEDGICSVYVQCPSNVWCFTDGCSDQCCGTETCICPEGLYSVK